MLSAYEQEFLGEPTKQTSLIARRMPRQVYSRGTSACRIGVRCSAFVSACTENLARRVLLLLTSTAKNKQRPFSSSFEISKRKRMKIRPTDFLSTCTGR